MNPNIQNSQQALAELQGYQSSVKNPNQILAEQNQQFGVGGAQETVTGLRSAIDNTTKLLKQVAPSVMGRTGSSLVTSAQANRQIGNEQAPITGQLTDLGRDYGTAREDLSSLQDKAAQASQGVYQSQKDREGYLQNLYTTLYQREQAAEAARQAELDRQEQIRQFNEQLAASRRVSGGGGGSSSTVDRALAALLGGGQATQGAVSADGGQKAIDSQYLGRLMAETDLSTKMGNIATLRKQAKAGNALAARRFELGKQLGYWKF